MVHFQGSFPYNKERELTVHYRMKKGRFQMETTLLYAAPASTRGYHQSLYGIFSSV